ncbi:MAG: ABC transporter permease [Vicinamibacterales bacterium]
MSAVTTVHLALQALGRHRMRSALSLLGIAIGVAVVIVMVSVGAGAQQRVAQHVRAAGAHLVTVTAGNYSPGDLDPSSGDVADASETTASGRSEGPRMGRPVAGDGWAGMAASPRLPGRGASTRLEPRDALAIAAETAGVRRVSLGVAQSLVIGRERASVFGRLLGTDAALLDIRGLRIRSGRFLTDEDVRARRSVVVLSADASDRLFGTGAAPSGQTVRVRARDFTVVGVAEPAGVSATPAAEDEAYAPYTALQDLLGIAHLHSISVSAEQAGDSTRIARDVTRLLRARHGLGTADPDDFIVRTQAREAVTGKGVNPLLARAVAGSVVNLDQVTLAEIATSLERSSRTMTALLVSVASVSLLVGGIGIMNVMLVSVTERTREIGLRMAVGARGRDVLLQFLAEAIALSALGGLVGVVVGVAGSGGLGRAFRWSTAISPGSVAIAVGAAALVGVFFGFYPARQASQLDPIDALRFE